MRRLTVLIAALALLALEASSAAAYYSGVLAPGDPLAGHPWFIDRARGAWFVALRQHPREAAPLRLAAENPTSKTIGSFSAHPEFDARDYIRRAQSEQRGALPFINVGRLESQSCPYPSLGPYYSERAVDNWMLRLSHGIGTSRIAVMIETDRLTTIRCLPGWAQNRRYRELRRRASCWAPRTTTGPRERTGLDCRSRACSAASTSWSTPARTAGALALTHPRPGPRSITRAALRRARGSGSAPL
jgi:hypothetical protein